MKTGGHTQMCAEPVRTNEPTAILPKAPVLIPDGGWFGLRNTGYGSQLEQIKRNNESSSVSPKNEPAVTDAYTPPRVYGMSREVREGLGQAVQSPTAKSYNDQRVAVEGQQKDVESLITAAQTWLRGIDTNIKNLEDGEVLSWGASGIYAWGTNIFTWGKLNTSIDNQIAHLKVLQSRYEKLVSKEGSQENSETVMASPKVYEDALKTSKALSDRATELISKMETTSSGLEKIRKYGIALRLLECAIDSLTHEGKVNGQSLLQCYKTNKTIDTEIIEWTPRELAFSEDEIRQIIEYKKRSKEAIQIAYRNCDISDELVLTGAELAITLPAIHYAVAGTVARGLRLIRFINPVSTVVRGATATLVVAGANKVIIDQGLGIPWLGLHSRPEQYRHPEWASQASTRTALQIVGFGVVAKHLLTATPVLRGVSEKCGFLQYARNTYGIRNAWKVGVLSQGPSVYYERKKYIESLQKQFEKDIESLQKQFDAYKQNLLEKFGSLPKDEQNIRLGADPNLREIARKLEDLKTERNRRLGNDPNWFATRQLAMAGVFSTMGYFWSMVRLGAPQEAFRYFTKHAAEIPAASESLRRKLFPTLLNWDTYINMLLGRFSSESGIAKQGLQVLFSRVALAGDFSSTVLANHILSKKDMSIFYEGDQIPPEVVIKNLFTSAISAYAGHRVHSEMIKQASIMGRIANKTKELCDIAARAYETEHGIPANSVCVQVDPTLPVGYLKPELRPSANGSTAELVISVPLPQDVHFLLALLMQGKAGKKAAEDLATLGVVPGKAIGRNAARKIRAFYDSFREDIIANSDAIVESAAARAKDSFIQTLRTISGGKTPRGSQTVVPILPTGESLVNGLEPLLKEGSALINDVFNRGGLGKILKRLGGFSESERQAILLEELMRLIIAAERLQKAEGANNLPTALHDEINMFCDGTEEFLAYARSRVGDNPNGALETLSSAAKSSKKVAVDSLKKIPLGDFAWESLKKFGRRVWEHTGGALKDYLSNQDKAPPVLSLSLKTPLASSQNNQAASEPGVLKRAGAALANTALAVSSPSWAGVDAFWDGRSISNPLPLIYLMSESLPNFAVSLSLYGALFKRGVEFFPNISSKPRTMLIASLRAQEAEVLLKFAQEKNVDANLISRLEQIRNDCEVMELTFGRSHKIAALTRGAATKAWNNTFGIAPLVRKFQIDELSSFSKGETAQLREILEDCFHRSRTYDRRKDYQAFKQRMVRAMSEQNIGDEEFQQMCNLLSKLPENVREDITKACEGAGGEGNARQKQLQTPSSNTHNPLATSRTIELKEAVRLESQHVICDRLKGECNQDKFALDLELLFRISTQQEFDNLVQSVRDACSQGSSKAKMCDSLKGLQTKVAEALCKGDVMEAKTLLGSAESELGSAVFNSRSKRRVLQGAEADVTKLHVADAKSSSGRGYSGKVKMLLVESKLAGKDLRDTPNPRDKYVTAIKASREAFKKAPETANNKEELWLAYVKARVTLRLFDEFNTTKSDLLRSRRSADRCIANNGYSDQIRDIAATIRYLTHSPNGTDNPSLENLHSGLDFLILKENQAFVDKALKKAVESEVSLLDAEVKNTRKELKLQASTSPGSLLKRGANALGRTRDFVMGLHNTEARQRRRYYRDDQPELLRQVPQAVERLEKAVADAKENLRIAKNNYKNAKKSARSTESIDEQRPLSVRVLRKVILPSEPKKPLMEARKKLAEARANLKSLNDGDLNKSIRKALLGIKGESEALAARVQAEKAIADLKKIIQKDIENSPTTEGTKTLSHWDLFAPLETSESEGEAPRDVYGDATVPRADDGGSSASSDTLGDIGRN